MEVFTFDLTIKAIVVFGGSIGAFGAFVYAASKTTKWLGLTYDRSCRSAVSYSTAYGRRQGPHHPQA